MSYILDSENSSSFLLTTRENTDNKKEIIFDINKNGKLRQKKRIVRHFKKGEWSRDEVVKAYTLGAIMKKFEMVDYATIRKCLFNDTRDSNQIKIKIKKLCNMKFVSKDFWDIYKEYEEVFLTCDINEHPKLIKEINMKMYEFLSLNGQLYLPEKCERNVDKLQFSCNFKKLVKQDEVDDESGIFNSNVPKSEEIKKFENISLTISPDYFKILSKICERKNGMITLDFINISNLIKDKIEKSINVNKEDSFI